MDASLVRSRLTNALTGAPPALALARDGSGVLTGWCAVRLPEPHEERARLWGPVVASGSRRSRIGSRLLHMVTEAVEWPLMTTDVPLDRPGAALFFTVSGWQMLDTFTVLHRSSPTDPVVRDERPVTATGAGDLTTYVARAARQYGGHNAGFARMTLQRWRDDARFRPQHLLLDPATGSLLLALAQRTALGSELLLAEVWAAPAVRPRLIRAALALAAEERLATVRTVTRQDPAPFVACGMNITGTCQIFGSPGRKQPELTRTPEPREKGSSC
ncbi:hypothetical protein [Streptomyces exfoliatus]|uniref:hypothetical protein n=1 Tax=Streptomyces exfoliatus TaxID=1905 RepID=UPI0012FE9929|nr:hypothetical protein [Streptomyces exfoliatus]